MSGGNDAAARLEIVPVTPERIGDLDTLFATGDPRDCQCAFVRLTNAEWSASTPAANRAVHLRALEAAADDGRAAGLIAYRDGAPVGWVSFDRRDAYGRLRSSPLYRPVDDKPVWSVVCFVVAAAARRTGVAATLLDATVRYAREHGARILESYPVDVSAGLKRSSAALWRGTVPMFEKAGFQVVEVRRQHASAPSRPIMRRRLRPRRAEP
jgi:GNAT superfamily N-acetyltransferase